MFQSLVLALELCLFPRAFVCVILKHHQAPSTGLACVWQNQWSFSLVNSGDALSYPQKRKKNDRKTERQTDRQGESPWQRSASSRSCPSFIMTVVEMDVVICEQAQASPNKAETLPNLRGLQVRCGKSAQRWLHQPRVKPRTKILCLLLFIFKSWLCVPSSFRDIKHVGTLCRDFWGAWPLARAQRRCRAGAGNSVSMADVQRADHTWLDLLSNKYV